MNSFSLPTVTFLLICLLLPHVQGTWPGKGLSRALQHRQIHVEVAPVTGDDRRGEASRCREEGCSAGATKKKASSSGPSGRSSKDWIPSIQEDYYGPRKHRPRHHKH